LLGYLDSNWAAVLHGDKFSALEVTFQIAILTPDAQFLICIVEKYMLSCIGPHRGQR
jgi:hypothetical protein